jgi:hypothetical protein
MHERAALVLDAGETDGVSSGQQGKEDGKWRQVEN